MLQHATGPYRHSDRDQDEQWHEGAQSAHDKA
jgi:hypothetical protein